MHALKPVQVMCANSDASWHDFTTSQYGANVIIDLQGSAEVRGTQLWLSPIACRYLNYGASAPLPTLNYPSLAPSINTLTHEAIHLRGESDEGVTECDAMHEIPRVAVRFFHVSAGSGYAR